MGNSCSNSAASISIAIEKPKYFAGELVQGYVQANVIEKTSCSNLFVHLYGAVNTSIEYQVTRKDGDGNSYTENKVVTDHLTCLDSTIHIATFPAQEILPGNYQFEFSIQLPNGLPPSCPPIYFSKDRADVTYTAGVRMERPGFFKKDLIHTVLLDIWGNPPAPSPKIWQEDEQNVNFCCCFNRGRMSLSSSLPTDVYYANDEIPVTTEINNKSSQPVDEIRVTLVETVSIRVRGSIGDVERSRTHTSKIAKECMDGLDPNSGFGADFNTEPWIAILRTPHQSSLKHSTLQTSILSIHHDVCVEARTGMCITNPMIQTPIFLQREEKTLCLSADDIKKVTENSETNQLPIAEAIPYAPDANLTNSQYQVAEAYGRLEY